MELELKTTRLDGFDIGAEQILTHEETADTIAYHLGQAAHV